MAATMKLGELVAAEGVLTRISSSMMSGKTAYHMGRLLDLVGKETSEFQKQRSGLIKQFGEERDVNDAEKAQGMTGKVFEVLPANLTEFSEKMNEVSGIEVSIDKWLITPDILNGLQMSGVDARTLGPLIVEG